MYFMKLTRIILLLSLSFFTASCSQNPISSSKTSNPDNQSAQNNLSLVTDGQGLSILQGFTTDEKAQFSILHPKSLRPLIFVRSFEDLKNFRPKPIEVKRFELPESDWAVSVVDVFSLRPNQNYKLEVWTRNKFRKLDERTFSTLDLNKKIAKILVAACMDVDPKYQQKKMWTEALSQKPDLLFILGDSIYGSQSNYVSTLTMWDDFVLSRRTLELYRADPLVPTLSTWDDHDYGMKDGDRSFPLKEQALNIYSAFFPQTADDKYMIEGPGLAHMFSAFGFNFYFLDGRSFRSPAKKSPDGEGETQWGAEQEAWLLKRVQQSNKASFLIQGDQFFGAYHKYESYEGQRPKSFKQMMGKLSHQKAPLMFISGDRHLTEVMGLKSGTWPYDTFEFTSSAIHARTYPGSFKEFPNPRQLKGVDGIQNYGILKIRTDGKTAFVRAQAYGPNKKKLFQEDFKIKAKP